MIGCRKAAAGAAAVFVFAAGALAGQERTTDGGVYTAAQAARGGAVYETQCANCHRDGGVAPVLTGEQFTRNFSDATLSTLFTAIKSTMPRNAPASLTDAEYTDIVAHLLRLNGFPDGMVELDLASMATTRIPGLTGSLDFALIQVVGCLSQGPGRAWTLGGATEPVRTREPDPAKDEEAAQLDAKPLGTRTFRLQQVYGTPAGWTGQKVAVKGFLTRSGTEERLTVTSVRPLTAPCPN